MEHIRVEMLDLPVTIRSFTVRSFDDGMDFFTIILNSRLSSDALKHSYDHEIEHINMKDFDSMMDVDYLEIIRH